VILFNPTYHLSAKILLDHSETNWKIMVFGKLRQNLKFTYENVDIEIVKQFNYLGVIFTKTCNFDVTKKHPADKALKAMYEVLKMGRLYKLSVKIQLDLFDKNWRC
jgi:hypothetical protein